MRRLLVFAAVLACASAVRSAPIPAPTPVRYGTALAPGDTVPPLKALALDGTPQTVAWSAGKLTLVNFWATWCTPCRQEMPELQALHVAREPDGLKVVGVVVQDRAGGDDIAAAANAAKAKYTLLWGGPEVEVAWGGVSILPTTFLIDPRGAIVRKYVGTNADEIAALKKDIDDYLAGRPLGDPYLPPPDPPPGTPPAKR
jgi:cytochrome c biogenesis protein CcmG, thiol:disulfide interchange protein DsbE